jgi:transcriptional regulator with XRE-family HTH domain
MQEMDTFLKEFGQTLKTTRKQMGLSQVTAAQNMKIDYRHYQNIEGGKINLRLDTMMKLVRFYNLTKNLETFNLEAFLRLLNNTHPDHHHQNWNALYEHFVEGGHAGYLVVRCDNKMVMQVNDRLFSTLGLESKQQLIGKTLTQLVNELGMQKIDDFCRHSHTASEVSSPFIVTFKTQPPAFPVPMMALLKVKKEQSGTGEDLLHCMFFDRKTLDEEGHRLSDIVSGYKQFMELYPQLKAV